MTERDQAVCDGCGKEKEIVEENYGLPYCEDCANNSSFHCSRCGEKVSRDFHTCSGGDSSSSSADVRSVSESNYSSGGEPPNSTKLPTVGYSYNTINPEGEEVWATKKLDPEMGDIQFNEKHELVRREDVAQLLKNHADNVNEAIGHVESQELTDEKQRELQRLQGRLRELQELLEAVQSEKADTK